MSMRVHFSSACACVCDKTAVWMLSRGWRAKSRGVYCSVNCENPESLSRESLRSSTVSYGTRLCWKIGKSVFFLRIFSSPVFYSQSLTQDDVMMIANLLPDWSELQSIPLTTPTTGAPALLSLIKLLRNACAGVPGNQSYLL